jgi:AcrR family transcriptional regulator
MKKYPQLVSQALALFYRQGFHATGVDQLAAEAALTKKTLYRYFASKEALIEAVLQQRDEDFMAALDAFVAPFAADARPMAYLGFLAQWLESEGFCGCLFINAAAEYPQHADAIHRQAALHKQGLQQWLHTCCQQADLLEAGLRARQLFLLGEGLIVSAQVGGPDPALLQAAGAQLDSWPRQAADAAIPTSSQ